MKKVVLFLGLVVFAFSVYAGPIIVPDYGETGWQTFTVTMDEDWTGYVGWGVSNYDDDSVSSTLLIDNISFGPTGNNYFQNGDFTGYTYYANTSIVTSATSYNGTTYNPTAGSNMAMLVTDGNGSNSSSVDTSSLGGTYGSFLWISDPISLHQGDIVSFDWAFFTDDYVPFYDFAVLMHTDSLGIPSNPTSDDYEVLAKIGVVPEPTTMLLLGSGILGLLGIGTRKKMSV